MADSVVEIVNTTLTSTELPDSTTSYDLITTDANTSYVIKDVQVDTLLSDLQTKINGFPVGNWAQNLTGSEVVDTSSTVSVTSSDFPVSIAALWYGFYGSQSVVTNGLGVLQGSVLSSKTADDSLAVAGFSSYYSGGGANALQSLVFNSDKSKLYQFWTDGNSSQSLRYWAAPGSSYTNLLTGNYNPVWYLPQQSAIYYKYSSNLNKIDIETGAISTIGSNLLSHNSPSFGSYVRWTMHGDWLFYRPSNNYRGSVGSYNAQIWAVNVTTGVSINFQAFKGYYGGADSGHKIAVSYDATSDKFVMYGVDTSTSYYHLVKDIFPITRTQMEAYTSNQTNNTPSDGSTTRYTDYTDIRFNYYSDQMIGHPSDGNKLFYADIDDGDLKLVDTSAQTETTVLEAQGLNSRGFLAVYPPNTSQVNELFGSDPSEIKIRITGVKTTTA